MTRETLTAIVRLLVLAAMALGFGHSAKVGVAEAACKACTSGECVNVEGGTTICTEFADGTCAVSGEICNS
jgi:hypothetical protein